MLHTVTLRRVAQTVTAGLFLLTAACKPDKDVVDEAFSPSTPLTLTKDSNMPSIPAMPTDNPLTVEGVELGRMLFYEKQLSSDGSISCGSCHQQSKAFTDGLAHAVGVNGQRHARSSMSLVNLVWQQDFTWDGAKNTLEEQARVPLENPVEMHQSVAASAAKLQQISKYPRMFGAAFGSSKITEENILKALAQFERTLISSNSKYDRVARRQAIFTADEAAGQRLIQHATGTVRGAECIHCHGDQLFVSPHHTFFNNGLDVPPYADAGRGSITGLTTDMGKFRAPTLRNIELTAPYMHDGRFQTLEEVIDHYSDHVQMSTGDPFLTESPNNLTGRILLTATEKRQILVFLKTLTDTTFTKDPRFSNPNP